MRHLQITLPPEPAPPEPSHGSTSYSNFDSNMVLILAALFCALICAVGLNSIIRCTLTCCRRQLITLAGPPKVQTGVKKQVLKKIPVEVYKRETEDSECEFECSICLGEFLDGERVRVLPSCWHKFHVRCIDTWLRAHSTCPMCRGSLFVKPLS
ncbi:hypothetical protein LUZ60_011030 [Juncus effusus]|nr:hypothetical protein LUZ60_011030 [Juncus effusus]